MKKFIIMAIAAIACGTTAFAQIDENVRKERMELMKQGKAALNEKVSKTTKKEAKVLAKEGWKSSPGTLPLEKQLERAYNMQYQYDDDMYPIYLTGNATSIGGNYDAARMQATELAKQSLAATIQQEVTSLVETTVSNKQLDPETAASVVETISTSKSLISQSLGRTQVITELYRDLKNGNKEVRIVIAYKGSEAKKLAAKIAQAELEKKGNKAAEDLDSKLGW